MDSRASVCIDLEYISPPADVLQIWRAKWKDLDQIILLYNVPYVFDAYNIF